MEVNPNSSSSPPSAGAATSTALANLSSNLDNFLTILTTQLQFQDPLSPLETYEFTNQLVLFTSVEQQVQQNKSLERLITLQRNTVALGAVSYIGQIVEATGRTTRLENGEARFSYFLPEDAAQATLRITNAVGDTVVIQDADTTAGVHDFVWNGFDSLGNKLPDGNYTFEVVAKNADDEIIEVDHTVFGRVTGVQFDKGDAILSIGDILVPLSQVNGVSMPRTGA